MMYLFIDFSVYFHIFWHHRRKTSKCSFQLYFTETHQSVPHYFEKTTSAFFTLFYQKEDVLKNVANKIGRPFNEHKTTETLLKI